MITSANLDYKKFKLLDPTLGKRVFNNAVATSLAEAAAEWHRSYLPKHFTRAGAQEYGYKARKGEKMSPGQRGYTRSYAYRKLKAFGHQDPLVFTGETKQLSRMRKIVYTSKQAKVVLPRKLNWKHPKSQISMRDEITAVSQPELDALRELAQETVARILQQGKES